MGDARYRYQVVEQDRSTGIVIDRVTQAPVTDVLPLTEAWDEVYALNHGGKVKVPKRAREMHEAGYSFGAIATELGISRHRAQQIVTAIRKEEKSESRPQGLMG